MRLPSWIPWDSKVRLARRVTDLKTSLSEVEQQRDEALTEVSRQLDKALQWSKATRQACDERDEALARVADLERALGQFSAGEAATELCDCEVSRWNLHLAGHCWQALVEANDEGKLTDEPWHVLASAKEAAKGSATRGQGHATELCDCELATLNTHREGSCRRALIEAEQQGRFIGEYGAELRQIKQEALGVSDCTCPPGWKHRAADCPFNPNPEQKQRQRYG